MREMSPAEAIFFAALEKASPAEQAAYLDAVCDGQPVLRARVEKLLAAHPRVGKFLEPSDAASELTGAFTSPKAAPSEVVGAILAGKYKLLQEVGEGGMGSVFMADQLQPVKRRVAVKVIKAGMDSARVLARFEAERQALALMDHPNIARVLDAGATDSGRPFFVMELVKGTPLTQFCDQHKLPVLDRLNLFMQICSAVQHAHQKGIIHRDLKPTNILVESHDGKAVPKVIDFGLAKATSGIQLSEHTLFTALGTVAGTPLYMAPEQAAFNAVDVDTRADVYALGVILYELLTGTTPIERETFKKAAFDEMLRMIREQEPATPSSRLSSSESKASVAAVRQMEPAKLGRYVKGELDWIVMKSLSKERDRRYESATAFARDIERFLNYEPVQAGPPSARYKLHKFCQRNKTAIIVIGAFNGLLLTTVFVVNREANRTRDALVAMAEQRQIAEDKEHDALKAAEEERQAKLREAAQLAIAIEQRAKAEKASDRTREVLDAMTSEATGDSLTTQKTITDEQKKFLVEVLTYYKEFAGEKSNDERARFRAARAASRVGHIEYRLGLKRESVAAFQLARDSYEKLAAEFAIVPDYRNHLAVSHNNAGLVLYELGKLDTAWDELCAARDIQKKLTEEFPAELDFQNELARTHNNLGAILTGLGRSADSQMEYKAAREIQKNLVEQVPTEPRYQKELARTHHNLAVQLAKVGRHEDAQAEYEAARAIRKTLVERFPTVPAYQQDLARIHQSLGALHSGMEKQDQARVEFEKARDIQMKLVEQYPSMPTFQQELARTHNGLGALYAGLGKRNDAQGEYRAASDLQKKLVELFPTVPGYQLELGVSHLNCGLLTRDDGHPTESLEFFDLAIRTLKPVHDREPRDANARQTLRDSHWGRARARDQIQRFAEAVKDWDRAIELSPPDEQRSLRASRATSRLQASMFAEAVADIAELTKLSAWNASQLYDFACIYAVVSTKIADKKQEYADRGMELLNKAVKAGYKDGAHMAKDTDLDPLRGRDDFKKLIADLESKSSPKPQLAPPPREFKK
jgi:eukaryotic-like serine/threonine-protein kinase